MRRQNIRDAKHCKRMFWVNNKAFAGDDSANDYLGQLDEVIYGPKPLDIAQADSVMGAIGAKTKL